MPDVHHTKSKYQTVATFLRCLVEAGGSDRPNVAARIAEERAPALTVLPKLLERAGVGAMSLGATDPYGFAKEVFTSLLVNNLLALLGRFTKLPPRLKVPTENSAGGNAAWVGDGLPVAVMKSTTATVTLDVFKLQVLTALSRELFRFGVDSENTFLRLLRADVSRFVAAALFDSTKSASSANPASLTNIAGHISSTGSSAAQITADLNSLISLIGTAMVDPTWVMRPKSFYRIAATLGGVGLTVSKENLFGIPVTTLSGMPQEIVLLDCASVAYASDDQAALEVSTDTTIEMSDGPSQSGISGTGAQMVSFWQTGLVGVSATLTMNWANMFMLNSSPNVPSGISYMTTSY